MSEESFRPRRTRDGVRLGIGSSLLALEASGATEILIRFEVERIGKVVVSATFPPGTAHALEVTRGAESIQEALGLVVEAVSSRSGLTIYHAARRAQVTLPEGGVGTLIFVSKDGSLAVVIASDGRHRSLPTVLLKLVPEAIPPVEDEVK